MLVVRALVMFGLLALIAMATMWAKESPGVIAVDWQGYHIQSSVALALAAVLLLAFVTAILVYGLAKLGHLPLRYRLQRARTQQAKALDAVTHALTSLAVADHGGALKYASQTERLLGDHALVELVRAHVARQRNDAGETEARLTNMLAHPSTRMLAASALSGLARRESRLDEAMGHAETAYRLLPGHLPSLLRLLDLCLLQKHWDRAAALVRDGQRIGLLSKPEARHYDAVRLHLEADAARRDGEPLTTRLLEAQAAKKEPGFVPATLAHAEALLAEDRWREGVRTLAKGWKVGPHPDLAALLVTASRGVSDKLRKSRLETMLVSQRLHGESELARARLALDMHQFDRAREAASLAAERLPQARSYRLLAEIERAANHTQAAARQQERAATAARPDPAWQCDACHRAANGWSLHCPHCDAFDTLHWGEAEAHDVPTTGMPESFALPYEVNA